MSKLFDSYVSTSLLSLLANSYEKPLHFCRTNWEMYNLLGCGLVNIATLEIKLIAVNTATASHFKY